MATKPDLSGQEEGKGMGDTAVCVANVKQPKKSKSGRDPDTFKYFAKYMPSWEGEAPV